MPPAELIDAPGVFFVEYAQVLRDSWISLWHYTVLASLVGVVIWYLEWEM